MNLEQWLRSDAIPFAIGLITIFLILEPIAVRLVRYVRKSIEIAPPKGITHDEWKKAMVIANRTGSKWIGILERIFFYVAFWIESPELAAGWLVFKVGSKWETWNNIIKVPEKLGESQSDLDYLGVRHKWGTRILQTWLVSTMANALSGLLAAALARTVRQFLAP